MNYNGKELVEMTTETWDGKTREMLVWSDYDAKPTLALVCGFTRKGHPIADTGNYTKANGFKRFNVFQYCAEIPEEESIEYSLTDCINSLKEHFKSKNEDSPDDEIAFPSLKESYKSIIKYLDELKSVKEENKELNAKLESFGELHKMAEFVQTNILEDKSENKPVKKIRRMTYKELDDWLEKGKGAFRIADRVSDKISYDCEDRNNEVAGYYKICGYDEDTWHEPLIEE